MVQIIYYLFYGYFSVKHTFNCLRKMEIRKIVALLVLCLSGICCFQVKAEESIKFAGIDICGPNYEKLIDKIQKDGFELVETTESYCAFSGKSYGYDALIYVHRGYDPVQIEFLTLEYQNMPLSEVSDLYTYLYKDYLDMYPEFNKFILFDPYEREQHMLAGGGGFISFVVTDKNAGNGVLLITYGNSKEIDKGTENKQGIGTDDL